MSLSSFSSLSSYSSESDIGVHHVQPMLPLQLTLTLTLVKDLRSLLGVRTGDQVRHLVTRTREQSEEASHPCAHQFKYDDGARALVLYYPHSPGSKSSISYSDINRWRAATIGGSKFTYSSESSVTVTAFTHRQLKSPFCCFRLQMAKSSVYCVTTSASIDTS
jgi:hypothetical protein